MPSCLTEDDESDANWPPALSLTALSHLELAVANIQMQAHTLHVHERAALAEAVHRLSRFATTDCCQSQDNRAGEDTLQQPTTTDSKVPFDGLAAGIFDADGQEKCVQSEGDPGKEIPIATEEPKSDELTKEIRAEAKACFQQSHSFRQSATLRNAKLYDQFMEIFEELDLNKEGSIDHMELRSIFREMNLPASHAARIFQHYDAQSGGMITRSLWMRMIDDFADNTDDAQLHAFMEALRHRYARWGYIYVKAKPSRCIIQHDSTIRVLWDLVIVAALFYLLLSLPMVLAFGEPQLLAFKVLGIFIDCFFVLDIIVNFRTSFQNHNMEVVKDGKAIARHYIRTWFLLDLVSSIPFDYLSENISMHPFKFFKVGKIAKSLRILRLGKMLKILQGSALIEGVEEWMWSLHCHALDRLLRLVFKLLVAGHWFACLLLALEDAESMLVYFSGSTPSNYQKYVAALYWSMMTMTTVGYGDVVMKTDSERLFAVIAMLFGGAFYGFVIGSITSLVSQSDLNRSKFKERMNLVMSWLDFHTELPRTLRRRVWHHFKDHLAKKTAIDDSIVMGDLSAALREEVAGYLLPEDIKKSPLFEGFQVSDFSNLVMILEKVALQPKEHVCSQSELGQAMFILVRGVALKEIHGRKPVKLVSGDSFGEDVLLGVRQRYSCTVVSHSKLILYKISVKLFEEQFKDRLDLISRMRQNFANIESLAVEEKAGAEEHGHSSLFDGAMSMAHGHASLAGVPATFPNAIFDALHDLSQKLDFLNAGDKVGK